MPYPRISPETSDPRNHRHAHLLTIQAAAANERSFTMGDNEVILMARREFGDFTHFPREPEAHSNGSHSSNEVKSALISEQKWERQNAALTYWCAID